MERVFVSSIQQGFSEVRTAARRGIESLGLQPLMAEKLGASPLSPQRALLDLVGEADVFLLILGPRYSQPTEDEFDEARRQALEIVVLRQQGEHDPDQADFVDRVAGNWKGGRFWGEFTDETDVGFAVVAALSNRANRSRAADLLPLAQTRAHDLASAGTRTGYGHEGSTVRAAFVPVSDGILLDAVGLEAPALGDQIAAIARERSLIPQSVGIEVQVSREGITLVRFGSQAPEPFARIHADGSIVCSSDVAGTDQFFGSMRVDPTRLEDALRRSGEFALAVWNHIDDREQVQQVAVATAIPDAQHKVYGASTGSNSISAGSSRMPATLLVPDPVAVVRRAELGGDQLTRQLVAEIRRVFVDAKAVQQ